MRPAAAAAALAGTCRHLPAHTSHTHNPHKGSRQLPAVEPTGVVLEISKEDTGSRQLPAVEILVCGCPCVCPCARVCARVCVCVPVCAELGLLIRAWRLLFAIVPRFRQGQRLWIPIFAMSRPHKTEIEATMTQESLVNTRRLLRRSTSEHEWTEMKRRRLTPIETTDVDTDAPAPPGPASTRIN